MSVACVSPVYWFCKVPSILPLGPPLPILLTHVLCDLCIPRSWVTEEIVGDDVEVVHVLFSLFS